MGFRVIKKHRRILYGEVRQVPRDPIVPSKALFSMTRLTIGDQFYVDSYLDALCTSATYYNHHIVVYQTCAFPTLLRALPFAVISAQRAKTEKGRKATPPSPIVKRNSKTLCPRASCRCTAISWVHISARTFCLGTDKAV